MFKKMSEPGPAWPLISGAHGIPEVHPGNRRGPIQGQGYTEAVGQSMALNWDVHQNGSLVFLFGKVTRREAGEPTGDRIPKDGS